MRAARPDDRGHARPLSRPRAALAAALVGAALGATACSSGPKGTPQERAAHDACGRVRAMPRTAPHATLVPILAQIARDTNVEKTDPRFFLWSGATRSWISSVDTHAAASPAYTIAANSSDTTVLGLLTQLCQNSLQE